MGKLKNVAEPVHWVLDAGIVSGAPDGPVCEMDLSWLEPSFVGFEPESETGMLVCVTDPLDPGKPEVVPAWPDPGADGLLGDVEPLDLESDQEKLEDIGSFSDTGAVFVADGLEGTPVEMVCPLDKGKLNDVLLSDPEGLISTPVDTECPLHTGKLDDVLSPLPGLVLDPEGLGVAPVETVCPLDIGKLKEVLESGPDALGRGAVERVEPPLESGKLNDVPASVPGLELDPELPGVASVEGVGCPLDTGKLKEVP